MESDQEQPNSWVIHLPGNRPRLYVTTGLRRLLTTDELQAVVAHELAHIANRDALVMSVVSLPGRTMMNVRGMVGYVAVLGVLPHLCSLALSRYRELAADAGAAALTGRPSALASALLKVSDSLTRIPTTDLRAAAAMNSFNLVAVNEDPRWWHAIPVPARLFASHPALQTRLEQLHALEAAQHGS
jgi:heat shock protein HtpX